MGYVSSQEAIIFDLWICASQPRRDWGTSSPLFGITGSKTTGYQFHFMGPVGSKRSTLQDATGSSNIQPICSPCLATKSKSFKRQNQSFKIWAPGRFAQVQILYTDPETLTSQLNYETQKSRHQAIWRVSAFESWEFQCAFSIRTYCNGWIQVPLGKESRLINDLSLGKFVPSHGLSQGSLLCLDLKRYTKIEHLTLNTSRPT